jgi:hypothetical protein
MSLAMTLSLESQKVTPKPEDVLSPTRISVRVME